MADTDLQMYFHFGEASFDNSLSDCGPVKWFVGLDSKALRNEGEISK